jgi:threonine dehydratase
MAKLAAVGVRMITLPHIQSALVRIRKAIYISPCTRSETFSELTGNTIYLKTGEPAENWRL